MKVQRIEGSRERFILIGMVVSDQALARISTKWTGDMCESTWANVVGQLCVDFYRKHGGAPGSAIEALYEQWAEDQRDAELTKLVERFLGDLSGEYERHQKEVNAAQVIDAAGIHFNRHRIERGISIVESALDAGQLERAEKELAALVANRVELGAGAGVDLFVDQGAVTSCMRSRGKEEELIDFRESALEEFFDGQLVRDSFVAIQAPEKSQKSFWLLELCVRAVKNRKRVALFEVGDMSEEQVSRRLLARVAQHPYRSPRNQWPYTVLYPTDMHLPKGADLPKVLYESRTFDKALDSSRAWEACEDLMKRSVKSKESYLRLSCHPNGSISVAGIEAILNTWALDGWIPDVVAIDYADLLVPPPGRWETERHAIDASWKQLRALSQKQHNLVLTPTQADAASYDKKLLSRGNFSGDKRKNAHVTGMFGINIKSAERKIGACRLNWIVRREGAYSDDQVVHVAGCLDLCCPAVKACWPER